MKWLESRILWGVLLIVGGLMFLLQNLGLIQFGSLFWALVLGLAGVFFLSLFVQNRVNWWALIPAFTLFGIAAVVALDALAPAIGEVISGSLVLGGIGLGFLLIYLVDRQNWWALIPAGVLVTLAVVAGLGETMLGAASGGVFFLGLGVTFSLVALLPPPGSQMKWAWIPALVLVIMGLLLLAATENLVDYIWPAALILAGGYLIVRTFSRRQR